VQILPGWQAASHAVAQELAEWRRAHGSNRPTRSSKVSLVLLYELPVQDTQTARRRAERHLGRRRGAVGHAHAVCTSGIGTGVEVEETTCVATPKRLVRRMSPNKLQNWSDCSASGRQHQLVRPCNT
jgi:hypothetical protein